MEGSRRKEGNRFGWMKKFPIRCRFQAHQGRGVQYSGVFWYSSSCCWLFRRFEFGYFPSDRTSSPFVTSPTIAIAFYLVANPFVSTYRSRTQTRTHEKSSYVGLQVSFLCLYACSWVRSFIFPHSFNKGPPENKHMTIWRPKTLWTRLPVTRHQQSVFALSIYCPPIPGVKFRGGAHGLAIQINFITLVNAFQIMETSSRPDGNSRGQSPCPRARFLCFPPRSCVIDEFYPSFIPPPMELLLLRMFPARC